MATSTRSEGSILSPYGEGYCTRCRFIVGLGPDGKMDRHTRGVHLGQYLAPPACGGSGRRPAKRTPFASEKSRFRHRPQAAVCGCGSEVKLVRQVDDRFTYSRHTRPGLAGGLCPNSFMQVPN
jgi:hypothetical protein